MNVIVESHIPYIKGRLEPFAHVEYLPAELITRQAVDEADALVVRTRTRCDKALLAGGRCRVVATATIGTDHVDLDYCGRAGITVVNAPGCNAPAVAQYVHATAAHLLDRLGQRPAELTIGIVGVGHVGSIVERWAREIGYGQVLLCDPPRARREGGDSFTSLDEVARRADIITFHTPLTTTGADATWHLCGSRFLESLEHCLLLINSARGAVADNVALAMALESGKTAHAAIDCWEGEPRISATLLERAFVATPHIAGYSAEGKMRATAMVLEALNSHFGWNAAVPWPSTPLLGATGVTLERARGSYNPLADTAALRDAARQGDIAQGFERLRDSYTLRHELA